MTIESNSEQTESQIPEILDENGFDVDDLTSDVVAENVTVGKKKASPRKKAVASSETKVKKAPVKRSRSTKADNSESSSSAPAMKAFWGVFNPMMVQVAQYSYAEEAEARQAAADLTEKKKAPHFVQLIKKVI